MAKKGLLATAENPYLESYGGSIEPSAIQKRRASTLTGYNVPSPASEFLRGFSGKEPAYSVMSPDANQMRRAYNLGEQASVASQFYGSVAPLAVGSTLANAARIPGAGAQIFIGPKAKTWNAEAAALAKQLESQGVDARSIWKETGTWKGPDGKWRQEISDEKSFYRGVQAVVADANQMKRADELRSEDVFLHPDLYKAYPSTGLSRIKETPYAGGSFNPITKEIRLGPRDGSSTMLHEQQHSIQEIEGFAKGGSPREIGDIMGELKNIDEKMKDAFDKYVTTTDDIIRQNAAQELNYLGGLREKLRPYADITNSEEGYFRLAGEAEARAVQRRMSLSPQQRRETFPEQSYDIDTELLIMKQD